MGKRIDIMVDVETLGTESDSTIFQIAAVAFDIKTGNISKSFNVASNIEKDDSLNVSGSTLKWWLKTNKELFEKLLNQGTLSNKEMLLEFYEWIISFGDMKKVYLWGNGILFDNKMIQTQFKNISLPYPIHYKNDRDVRTILELATLKLNLGEYDLKNKFKDNSLVAHDAFDDVKQQVNLISKCYNILLDNGVPQI